MEYRIIPVTHYQQNCSLIWCHETLEAALIDPGGDVDKIMAIIATEGVELTKIILTHGHLDHVGGVAEIVSRTGLPVEGPHIDDKFWLDQLPEQAVHMGFEPVSGFTPNRWLDNADEVLVGNLRLQVLHCPGHTPGHVVIFHKPSKLAFVGDVLFQGSIGRTDFPRGNFEQLLTSIRQQLWPLGDDVEFVPGHGPKSYFGVERTTNPFVGDNQA